jgi:tetratricopeptide (TPR) repeat protein
MKKLWLSIIFTAILAVPAAAQDSDRAKPEIEIQPPKVIIVPIPDAVGEADIITEEPSSIDKPDYSHLTPDAERTVRLDKLFERLKAETNAEDANLIAEDIWAVWLGSGSASVDFILRRGTAAQKRGEKKLARRMYDHVTTLNPDYAEGWARSSRLALEEKDLGRALVEASQALIYEPRHFYALSTMGNVFEQLGRQEEALEAYREANKLYPELKAVKDRLEALQSDIDGDVL